MAIWSTIMKALERFLNLIVPGLIVLIFIDVVVGVFFRYVLNSPLKFTFDLATLLFAWVIFLGLVLAAKEKAHISVDFVISLLPEKLRGTVLLFVDALTTFICGMMVYLGWNLTIKTGMEITGLEISMKWLYASLPVGFAILALFLVNKVVNQVYQIFKKSERRI